MLPIALHMKTTTMPTSLEKAALKAIHKNPTLSLFTFLISPWATCALIENNPDPTGWSSINQFSSGMVTLLLYLGWASLHSSPSACGIQEEDNEEGQYLTT